MPWRELTWGNAMSTVGGTSLVELAARGRLPHHQYVDHATLRWIEANKPQSLPEGSTPRLRACVRRLLGRTALPPGWMAEPKNFDSLHGVRHAMRTAALAALLAESVALDDDDTATLILAASVHDCRRHHDKRDKGHGLRAALWLTENADTVCRHFRLAPTSQRIDRAATAVRLHDVPNSSFGLTDRRDAHRIEPLCELLKAADALDRYRLPKLSWWPDSQHVDVDAFEELRAVAFDLVIRSEGAHLAGVDSASAVFEALSARELIG
jgi:hypothetical protein